jgi:hypothetical protein
MTDLLDRKSVELRQKLKALDNEFGRWLTQSNAGQSAQRHHSQVRAIAATLMGLRNRIGKRVKALASEPDPLAQSTNLQRLILAIYRVWEFFRAKLDQRGVAQFSNYLAAADELVWLCYCPVRDLVFPNLTLVPGKEPPLVFLNGGWSPFAAKRAIAFQAEDVAREMISDSTVKLILERQPIPVIGVPWYQIAHLPDALVLLHETGHVVEADFGLAGQLQRLLAETLAGSGHQQSHHACWLKWLPEVFADLYGCLAGGPTYAEALIDFLASGRANIETERSTEQNEYPSAYLRVLLSVAALTQLGFGSESRRILDEWRHSYPSHAMANFETDCSKIADAVIGHCTVENQPLRKVVGFTRELQEEAEEIVDRLRNGQALGAADVRAQFAAVRIAYQQDPCAYARRRWNRKLLEAINASLRPELRAGETVLNERDAATRDAMLKGMGAALYDELARSPNSDGSQKPSA